MLPFARDEVSALESLTKQGCTSAPTLLSWKLEKQGPRMWVPGGPIVFILMEKLPGICPGDGVVDIFLSLKREERDELREAFKRAWLYVTSCREQVVWILINDDDSRECASYGLINSDASLNNLMWDREKKKW